MLRIHHELYIYNHSANKIREEWLKYYYKPNDEGHGDLMVAPKQPLNVFDNFTKLIADDGQVRLAAAGLLEGMTWTIMAYLLDYAQLPALVDAILLSSATYLFFCIGYAIKPNPEPNEFNSTAQLFAQRDSNLRIESNDGSIPNIAPERQLHI